MQLKITTNFPEVAKALEQFQRNARPALREALNRTAEWVATDIRREMPKVFNRPVPYTLRSLRVFYGTTANLSASVWFKQRGADLDKLWAATQVTGGRRETKPMEKRLQAAGILPPGWFVVPGKGAPLDAYGNMSPGEISRILNVLGTFREAGFNTADFRTKNRLRKGTKKAYGFAYWVNPVGSTRAAHLPPGIYRRTYTGFGQAVSPMLIFVKSASYRPRLNMQSIAQQTIAKRFPAEMDRALRSFTATGSASLFRRQAVR